MQEEASLAMNHAFGPSFRGPSAGPNWAHPGFYGGFFNPATSSPYPPYPMLQGGGYGGPPFAPWYGAFPASNPWTNFAMALPEADDEIKDFVEQSLDNDLEIPAQADIHVDVHDGVVTLTGTVPNKRVKHAAGDDAWWLPPVLDVHNELNVQRSRPKTGTGPATGTASRRRTQSTGQ